MSGRLERAVQHTTTAICSVDGSAPGSRSRTSSGARSCSPGLQQLSGLTIGMWKSRAHESLYLLVLPDSFVFVVEASPAARKTSTVRRSGGAFSSPRERLNNLNASPIIKQLVSASPFSAMYDQRGGGSKAGAVFAFEVHHDRVAGVNYQNPLLRQGRLTVEAFGVTKRGFESMQEFRAWYGVGDVDLCRVCADGRPGSAARKSLQFRGEEGREERGGEDTEMSSFAFCVGGGGGEGLHEDVADDATSCVVERSGGSVASVESGVSVSVEDAGKKGKASEGKATSKKASPWSALKLRRKLKSPPSTENLPRLNIPRRHTDGDGYDDQWDVSRTPSGSAGLTTAMATTANTNETCEHDEKQASDGHGMMYAYRTISAEFTDPHVPCALAPVFKQHTQESERLLKMYESGLPTWAMFLPSYGMYYRPWLRSVTWVFFYVFSVVSLTLGFYDLYKTLPGLQDALNKLVESYHISVWWPIVSVYQWVESHAQIRLSILLTYLFGKSELFYSINMVAMQWFTYVFEPIRVVVMPFVWVLYAPLRLLYSLGSYALGVVYSPLTFAWSLASRVEVMQAARGTSSGWITVSEAMRQSLVTAMRASNNVWKFVVNMCGGVSRHRMTLGRRIGRNWDRLLRMIVRLYEEATQLAGGTDVGAKWATAERSDQNDELSFSNAFGSSKEGDEDAESTQFKNKDD